MENLTLRRLQKKITGSSVIWWARKMLFSNQEGKVFHMPFLS